MVSVVTSPRSTKSDSIARDALLDVGERSRMMAVIVVVVIVIVVVAHSR